MIMKSFKDLFEHMSSPEFQETFLRIVEEDRQEEIAFRRELVNSFNRKLESEGMNIDLPTQERQKRFVSLTMGANEVHAMAAEYAERLGRRLPPPPPSLTIEDI